MGASVFRLHELFIAVLPCGKSQNFTSRRNAGKRKKMVVFDEFRIQDLLF